MFGKGEDLHANMHEISLFMDLARDDEQYLHVERERKEEVSSLSRKAVYLDSFPAKNIDSYIVTPGDYIMVQPCLLAVLSCHRYLVGTYSCSYPKECFLYTLS